MSEERVAQLLDELGHALMMVRLAMTAADLVADGMSDDPDEPMRILGALCQRLVLVGALDPMDAVESPKETP